MIEIAEINAKSACYAAPVGHYSSTTGTVSTASPSKTYYMTVTSSDTEMRVALAYANRIKFSDPNNEPTWTDNITGKVGELKLEVFSPSGTNPIRTCNIEGANLKIVGFDPRPYGTGQFRIVGTQTVSASNPTRVTNFGVSWR